MVPSIGIDEGNNNVGLHGYNRDNNIWQQEKGTLEQLLSHLLLRETMGRGRDHDVYSNLDNYQSQITLIICSCQQKNN